jgi:hypothetical protein
VEALHQVQQLRVQGTEQSGGLLEEGRRQEGGGGREGAVEAVEAVCHGRVEGVHFLDFSGDAEKEAVHGRRRMLLFWGGPFIYRQGKISRMMGCLKRRGEDR